MYEVLSTTDYGLFRIALGNGIPEERKVRKLMESFKREYIIRPLRVFYKGGILFITDGKHRFEAAKRLGLPIYYIQTSRLGGRKKFKK